MTTYTEQLAGATTDTSLPKMYPGLLSSGTLMIIDPMDLEHPWPAGVPANASAIYNPAWDIAASIIGSGDAASLASPFVDQHGNVDAIAERSAKGGLHFIYSQTAQTGSASKGAAIVPAAAILNYMLTGGIAHRYYISIWHLVTRVGIPGAVIPPLFSALFKTGDAGRCFERMQTDGFVGNVLRSNPASGLNAVGPVRRAMVIEGWSGPAGSAPVDASGLDAALMMWGNYKSMSTLALNKSPSHIGYFGLIEDLTVSGREGADVDALDAQMFAEQVLTAGGRYYGDTFTDPATKP